VINILSVSVNSVVVQALGRPAVEVTWGMMRDSASDLNDEDLRPIYREALDRARAKAREAGLMGKRLEVPGALAGDLDQLGDEERQMLLESVQDEGWPYSDRDIVVVDLDPDQVEATRRDPALRARIYGQIRRAKERQGVEES
jgi:hypothetical protein